MSTIRAAGLGTLTASNTATIVDPATPAGGIARVGTLVSFSPISSSSQTSMDFVGIPSWARRVTMALYQVSLNSTASLQIQLGTSSGYATTGYHGVLAGSAEITTGFRVYSGGASALITTTVSFMCVSASSNIWVAMCAGGDTTGGGSTYTSVSGITLSGTLDRIRLYTSSGTDTFDSGTVNVFYE